MNPGARCNQLFNDSLTRPGINFCKWMVYTDYG